ncbi:ribonuclease P [Haloarcula sp. S1CR25-12]|uniref:Ribonuclease P protein component 3 n=1 Tax=Haloarcula saliterrae TaxID=2950534 RepID=A0ABU2F7I3_9EURY|nr:RNase P subunit p30 family protein [Haloarcula sp. S1CR25-12]MDS0258227.1 ribonuclease P [Haloarcula sp. S1CR25-12]
MYEAVHARPDGPSTVARQARTAADYGFDGVVVRNHGDAGTPDDIDAVADSLDVDVVEGVEIRADDPSQASGLVGNHRSKRTIVAVHGGDRALNRFAVENSAVDVLAHPMAGNGDFNHVLAKAAADNGVRIEFSLRSVVHESGGSRVRQLGALRKLRELVADADAPYVVSSDPRSHLEFRAPRELCALGEQIGFDADDIRAGLVEWGRLADRNRDRAGDSYVEPGVRLDEPE